MKAKIFFISMLMGAGMISCDKGNEIKNDDSLVFSIRRSGGWTGLDETMTIKRDSTYYSIRYYTAPQLGYQRTIKTSEQQWDSLKKTFDLETFTKIQDGYCISCVDGIDETFSVTKDGKTYFLYNGAHDEIYKKMQAFFDIILEQITVFEVHVDAYMVIPLSSQSLARLSPSTEPAQTHNVHENSTLRQKYSDKAIL